MARKKTAQDLAIDLALGGGEKGGKKRSKKRSASRGGSLGKICDISSAQAIIKKFATLKNDVDLATIGAVASSQSVLGGGRSPSRKRKGAPFGKKSAKKGAKKRARKAA